MKASEQDVLTTQLYFKAAFPALRIPLEEDPKQVEKFKTVNAVVEFRAADDASPQACYLVFLTEEMAAKSALGKRFKVYQGEYPGYIEMADGSKYEELKVVKMYFKSIPSLLGVFKGNSPAEMLGIVTPLLKNILNPVTLKFLFLMLMLTKTMPNYTPGEDEPWEQYLKVKMSLFLITRALSNANKLGWPLMADWTLKQPDRTYQFEVGATLDKDGKELYPAITSFLRVKNGKTKAGNGLAKYPFVHFKFSNPDGCLALLTGRYDFVECVNRGCVTILGAGDSYAISFNNVMTKCQNMLIPSKFVQ